MKLRLPATAAAAGIAGVAVALRMVYGAASRSSQLFGPSVYRGDGSRKSIALTFDDGPSEGSLHLIDYLAAERIPATFFQCGKNVEHYPAIARTIYEMGHEIGNHTYSHPRLSPRISWQVQYRSPAFIETELSRTQHIIEAEIGSRPTLMRAPYGLRWYGLAAAQQKLGLLGVMWTVIGRDWEWPAYAIADLVLKRSSPGGIVCLHDGRDIQPKSDISQTLKALRRIVPELKDAGYSFETVSSLIQPR
jgi:peptidoglycan/xylan/chitin deacetylase (PgdA/CDA1 family)